jgi:hypothetical protein
VIGFRVDEVGEERRSRTGQSERVENGENDRSGILVVDSRVVLGSDKLVSVRVQRITDVDVVQVVLSFVRDSIEGEMVEFEVLESMSGDSKETEDSFPFPADLCENEPPKSRESSGKCDLFSDSCSFNHEFF